MTNNSPILFVTGGAGFIGSNFVRYILEKYPDYHVINFDNLTYAGHLENLSDIEPLPQYTFIKGDIGDAAAVNRVFETYPIRWVVNFAAESHVDRSIENPEVFLKTNVLGTGTLLNVAQKFWENNAEDKRFLQVSTDEVYGSLGDTGYFTESTPLDPRSPYSASKAGSDLLAKAYFDTYALPVLITRCSNNYGPYQYPEKLIPLMINQAIHKNPLPVYGDGLYTRDWLHVLDHCSALDAVLHRGKVGDVYNIGGNSERRNMQVVKHLIQFLNENVDSGITESLITHVTDRKGHDRRYAIDATKLKSDLGWEPSRSFEGGLNETILWYLNHQEWVKTVLLKLA